MSFAWLKIIFCFVRNLCENISVVTVTWIALASSSCRPGVASSLELYTKNATKNTLSVRVCSQKRDSNMQGKSVDILVSIIDTDLKIYTITIVR